MDSVDQANVLIDVQGLVASELPAQDTDAVFGGNRELCYELGWRPYVGLLTQSTVSCCILPMFQWNTPYKSD